MSPAVCVGATRCNVRAEHLLRYQLSRPAVHELPFQRIDAVAYPGAVRAFQPPKITTGAARGAALDLQAGVGGLDLVDKAVEGERLLVHPWPPVGRTAGIDQVAVVIPLDVADLVLGEDVEDRVADVGIAVGNA